MASSRVIFLIDVIAEPRAMATGAVALLGAGAGRREEGSEMAALGLGRGC